MTVLLNGEITGGLAIAQSIHAIDEFRKHHGFSLEHNGYVQVLSAQNESCLLEQSRILERKHVPYYMFREPDLGMKATAIVAIGTPNLFSRFKPY